MLVSCGVPFPLLLGESSGCLGSLTGCLMPYWRFRYASRSRPCWNSGMTKLADWNATLSLFTDEYQVPLLPPELAANLALAIEVTTPVLLVLGLLTRAAALVLLGMTAVIEIFVYPQAWPTHIQWAAMLLVLLC